MWLRSAEVLRGWLDGAGLRTVAERAGVDRKTARRYVQAAEAAGLSRDAGLAALSDELIGAVVGAVRPARPSGHGAAWDVLQQRKSDIAGWVKGGLTIVKIEVLLTRSGTTVPYRTLQPLRHRGVRLPATGHHGAGAGRRPRSGMPDRLRPDGVHHRPGHGPAAEGPRVDLHRRVLPPHVRPPHLLTNPGGGDRRLRSSMGVLPAGCSRC